MIALVVALFRACGKPRVESGMFSHDGHCPESLRSAIEACGSITANFGSFEEDPIFNDEKLTVKFSWELSSNDSARFYGDVVDFVVHATSLSRGAEPANYYLICEDHLWSDIPKTHELKQAYQLCNLIKMLRHLCPGDLTSDNNSEPAKLFFVLPARESRPLRSVELVTRILPELLSIPHLNLEILVSLLAETSNQTLHIHDLRSVFRLAIADSLAKKSPSEESYAHVVKNWDLILCQYNFDADCYVNKYSFEKIRDEIAKASVEFASKLTNIASDGASKLLALPLSMAATFAIFKTDGAEIFLLALSGLLVSTLLAAVVKNQSFQMEQVKTNFDLVFGQLIEKQSETSAKVLDPIAKAKLDFEAQRSFVERVVTFSRLLVWLPPVASCFFIWRKLEVFSWRTFVAIFGVYLFGLLVWWGLERRKIPKDSIIRKV